MNKKAFLFSITAMLLFLSILTLILAYFDRNKELQASVTDSFAADKIRFIEDDVIGSAYSDLLGVELKTITRGSTVDVFFNKTILGRDSRIPVLAYKDFVENDYSGMNNLEVNLTRFYTNFTIWPYNTTFIVDNGGVLLKTMPKSNNPVVSVGIEVKVKGQLQGTCSAPDDDGLPYPLISVTFNYEGGTCTADRRLNPAQDNDKLGRQFFIPTTGGNVEVKYGRITSWNGDLTIYRNSVPANVTKLDIGYSPDTRVFITGGNISIKSGGIVKKSRIILAEE